MCGKHDENTTMTKKLCAIQMSISDITDGLTEFNSVVKLKESNLFDEVVIVAPDIPSTDELTSYSTLWNIPLFRGEPQNVSQRYIDCAAHYGADIICRVLPQLFYVDIPLIASLLDQIEKTKVDYILLPRDFDIRFGGDVTTADLFQKVIDLHGDNDPTKLFNPWGLAENYVDQLNIGYFDDVPEYSNEHLADLRKIMNDVWPEHWDSSNTPMFSYKLVASMIDAAPNRKTNGLDLACGYGMGTKFLHDKGFSMTGVDIIEDVVDKALEQFGDMSNDGLRFIASDYADLKLESESLDFVVSIHTMEHVQDDNHFLETIHGWLKDDAYVIIEVPLLYHRPFSDSGDPWNPFHIREYKTNELISLMAKYFNIIDAKGVSRGNYIHVDDARNAAMVIAQKGKS